MTHRQSSAAHRSVAVISPIFPIIAHIMAVGVLFAGVIGCDGQENKSTAAAPAHTEVGVVDFERVFKELGWLDEINASAQKTSAEYGEKVDAFKRDLKAALQTNRTRIAEAARLNKKQRDDFDNDRDLDKLPLTPQQREEYAQSLRNINGALQGFAGQAQQLLQTRKNDIVTVYKDSMQPALRRAAEGAGMTILATPAQVVYFSNTVDVTNKVIDDLRSAPPPHTLPEPPVLNMPKIEIKTPEATTAPTGKPSTRASTRSSAPPQK